MHQPAQSYSENYIMKNRRLVKITAAAGMLPVRDCTNEFKPRPLHILMGNPTAIGKMEQEFPNHWNFHPRRRYGKTAKDKAAGVQRFHKNVRFPGMGRTGVPNGIKNK